MAVSEIRPAIGGLLLVAGCFHPDYRDTRCAPGGECPGAMTCGARGICEDCVTFASQFDTCQLTLAGDLELSGAVAYNTTNHELRASGETMPVARMMLETKAGDIDAILAHDLRFAAGATLRAIGARPLAIVASGSIVLGALASIDAGVGGAGALPACATPPGPGGDTVDSEPGGGGGAGGGGAGYGASGGRGGDGDANGILTLGGAAGSSRAMPAGPTGGCPGARGGLGNVLGGSDGGWGGGALYIVAADRIDLGSGAILIAGGGGGHGGLIDGGGGGGGGGSGGMIWLEAPHVSSAQAVIAVNGGGGGEGGDGDQPGNDGLAGSPSVDRAPGGIGATLNGGAGGRGGSKLGVAGESVSTPANGGGGGGGGSVGFIRVVSDDAQLGTVSPDPS